MSITINTNPSSLVVQLSMKGATIDLNRAIERMTTGYKINHASDNAAGYSISTNMTTKVGAYLVAETNATMGLDMVLTAVDTLDLMNNQLSRLRSLAIQAQNGTHGSKSISALQAEANTIIDNFNQLMSSAEYNGKKLFSEVASASGFNQSNIPTARTMSLRTLSQVNEPEVQESTFIDEITPVDTSSLKTLTSAVADGETIKGGTWAIGSVEDLVKLAELTNTNTDITTGTTFVLSDDIDLSSIDNWTPIGIYTSNAEYAFRGTFEGNGHKISNLTINNTSQQYQGLFGYVSSATIKNLGLENIDVNAANYAGGLIGYSKGNTAVTNCYSTGKVNGSNQVGGLFGDAFTNNYITSCYSTCTVSGNQIVGGLVGHCGNGEIISSFATGNVSGSYRYIGGLVGQTYAEDINSCYATGNVNGTTAYSDCIGGLVGFLYCGDEINSSYATGNVTGNNKVGGLIGYMDFGRIKSSYATGNVTGTDAVGGGLSGEMNLDILI